MKKMKLIDSEPSNNKLQQRKFCDFSDLKTSLPSLSLSLSLSRLFSLISLNLFPSDLSHGVPPSPIDFVHCILTRKAQIRIEHRRIKLIKISETTNNNNNA